MGIRIYKIVLMLMLSVLCKTTIAQNRVAYYDAKNLAELFKNNGLLSANNADIRSVLRFYMPVGADISARVTSNPFLKAYFPAGGGASITTTEGGILKSGTADLFKNIGGLNVTNFADGVARFLAKRFKDELTITFFQTFNKEIAKSAELAAFFPESYKVLSALGSEIYQFNAYLNTLREAFIKDITNLYVNCKRFIQLPKYQAFINTHPELNTMVTTAFYLVDQYASGAHPGDVLARFDVSTLKFSDQIVQNNTRSFVSLTQEFSGSLRSFSPEHYWVPADSVKNLFNKNTAAVDFYFGLLYEKIGTMQFYPSAGPVLQFGNLLAMAKAAGTELNQYVQFAEAFIDHAQEVSEYLAALKSKPKSEIDYNDYHNLYNASIDLIEHSLSFTDLPHVDLGDPLEKQIVLTSCKYLFAARTAGELYVDVRVKNYSSAVLNVITLSDTFFNYRKLFDIEQVKNDAEQAFENIKILQQKYSDLQSSISGIKKQFREKYKEKKEIEITVIDWSIVNGVNASGISLIDKQNAIAFIKQELTLEIYVDHLNLNERLKTQILKYGTLMASIAMAKSSEEVQAAIEAIALPAGSARIKRESLVNISLNAYVGGFGGWEYLPALKQKPTSSSLGLTAPVGVAFSLGNIKEKANKDHGAKSITFFIPVIDVGALASFRLQNDSSKVASEVQLKNIIAPGLFVYYGFGKCPVSIGFGAQIGPQLREISTKDPGKVDLDKNYYVRYGFSLAVDIPVLNFYTKPKKAVYN